MKLSQAPKNINIEIEKKLEKENINYSKEDLKYKYNLLYYKAQFCLSVTAYVTIALTSTKLLGLKNQTWLV